MFKKHLHLIKQHLHLHLFNNICFVIKTFDAFNENFSLGCKMPALNVYFRQIRRSREHQSTNLLTNGYAIVEGSSIPVCLNGHPTTVGSVCLLTYTKLIYEMQSVKCRQRFEIHGHNYHKYVCYSQFNSIYNTIYRLIILTMMHYI